MDNQNRSRVEYRRSDLLFISRLIGKTKVNPTRKFEKSSKKLYPIMCRGRIRDNNKPSFSHFILCRMAIF